MQMVSGVETGSERCRITAVADSNIEIYATIEQIRSAQPIIEFISHLIAHLIVSAPSEDRKKRSAPYFQSEFASILHVDFLRTTLQILTSRHVAPRSEWVYLHTNRMYDVIDTMLNDDSTGACHIHLDRETRLALESVCLIRDAVILSEYSCSADSTTYDSHIMETILPCSDSKPVGPALRCDRIAKANEGMILFFCQHIYRIEEVKPVGITRQVDRKFLLCGEISIGILTLGERACDESAGIHLSETSEIHAHIDCLASLDVESDLIALHLFSWLYHHRSISSEGDRHSDVVLILLCYVCFSHCDVFRTRKI